MDFNIDGLALLDAMIRAKVAQDNDAFLRALIPIFQKYGLTTIEGMAFLLELSAVLEQRKDEE